MKKLLTVLTVCVLTGCASKPFVLGDKNDNKSLVVFSVSYDKDCSSWFGGSSGSIFIIDPENKDANNVAVILSNPFMSKDFKDINTTVYAKKVTAGNYSTSRVNVPRTANSLLIVNVLKDDFDTPKIPLKAEVGKAHYWGSFHFYDPKGGDCSENFDIRQEDFKERDVNQVSKDEPAALSIL